MQSELLEVRLQFPGNVRCESTVRNMLKKCKRRENTKERTKRREDGFKLTRRGLRGDALRGSLVDGQSRERLRMRVDGGGGGATRLDGFYCKPRLQTFFTHSHPRKSTS